MTNDFEGIFIELMSSSAAEPPPPHVAFGCINTRIDSLKACLRALRVLRLLLSFDFAADVSITVFQLADVTSVLTHFFNMESELPVRSSSDAESLSHQSFQKGKNTEAKPQPTAPWLRLRRAQILRELNLRNRARTKEERSAVLKMPEPPPETGLLRTDLIEMRIENVSFNYRPNQKLLENVGLLHVPLGKIECPCYAKQNQLLLWTWVLIRNTFLRLIASRLLPEKGEIFVPTHLNLTYGAPDNSDLDVVKGVLRLLNIFPDPNSRTPGEQVLSMARLIALALVGSAYAACESGSCDADDTELMQVDINQVHQKDAAAQMASLIERAFAGVRGKGRSPTAASIINEAFGNVTEDGGYLLGNIKADATWEECTRIDWNEVAKFDDEEGKLSPYSVERMLKELHLQACLDGESDWAKDDTCKAVKAALEVSTELSHDPFEPLFANFSVVAWGKYPSWVKDTVVDLDYSKPMPVKAKVKDPKGVIGYAICDLLRVILTQSADQMSTGTCSYVASLAALSHKAPAKLIKLAVRLFWTGMITPKVGKACDGIYHQQPGLVPFKSGYGWIPSFYQNGGSASCAGSAMDCATSQGRPQQNAALTFSWTQYLISTWMKENWGYCQKDGVRSGLTYPGQDDYEAAMATRNQGGWYNSMFWECANFIDPEGGSCKLLVNPNTCVLGEFEVCEKKWSLEPAFEVQSEVWEPLVVKYRTEAWMQGAVSYSEQEKYVIPKLHEAFAEKPLLRDYLEFLQSLANKTGESVFEINEVSGPPFPSFTEELLKQTCEAYTNLLVIDATVLQVAFSNPGIIQQARDQDLPLFGNFGLPSVSYGCNHAVYLQSCDFKKDLFKIWTWGTTVTLSKRMLLGWPAAQRGYPTRAGASWTWNTGAICASVTADQITVD
ncbi:unnamed protein product [Effrenium voratum]|uniref:Uncharacterized protein n=1 Tax=Effrenium voratum TaxID=2562239 RepID=A0AA36IG53_9DINO|nr:unnamed protein product [Effrenium voratum]